MRGQAWVVFDQLNSATRAQRELQNFLFFGKPLRITFAKAKSDVLAKMDGTFQQRQKRKAGAEDGRPKKGSVNAPAAKRQKTQVAPAAAAPSAVVAAPAAAAAAPAGAGGVQEPPPPPHRILFVENLPAASTDLMLSMLFQQYPGFTEARVIPGKGVAFVEFKEVFQAAAAMEALQGFKVTQTNLLKITFAKK
jgi:U1 small nuclear ribonucleoprotein A